MSLDAEKHERISDASVASVADGVTMLDSEVGDAIGTEHLRNGYRVVVIGNRCYDVHYMPIEQRLSAAAAAVRLASSSKLQVRRPHR